MKKPKLIDHSGMLWCNREKLKVHVFEMAYCFGAAERWRVISLQLEFSRNLKN